MDASAHKRTFADHLTELRGRLFYIALWFIASSTLGFVGRDAIIEVLVRPLQAKIYYSSPIGSVDFVFSIALWVGAIVTVPFGIYQLLSFVRPATRLNQKTIVWTTGLSCLLSMIGIGFAYFVTLPAALHFLTSFASERIDSLFTAKEYLGFVSAYVFSFVLVFELPLLFFVLSNSFHITNRKLLSSQRWVIVAIVIVSALITPTPDPINQALVAGPMLISYECAVIAIMIKNRRKTSPYLQEAMDSEATPSNPINTNVFEQTPKILLAARTTNQNIIHRSTATDKLISKQNVIRPVNTQSGIVPRGNIRYRPTRNTKIQG